MYSPAVEPPAHPERQPGHSHTRPLQSLSVEHPDGYIRQRRDIPAHLITSNYTALRRHLTRPVRLRQLQAGHAANGAGARRVGRDQRPAIRAGAATAQPIARCAFLPASLPRCSGQYFAVTCDGTKTCVNSSSALHSTRTWPHIPQMGCSGWTGVGRLGRSFLCRCRAFRDCLSADLLAVASVRAVACGLLIHHAGRSLGSRA
jgi:hypothetical protein